MEEEEAPLVVPRIVDMPFDEFQRNFGVDDKLENPQDAKEFCHFLAKRVAISKRERGHIESLRVILTQWHGSAKHAAWRLAESLGRPQCPSPTRAFAEVVLIECLTSPSVTNYAKYRLLHHLTRPRQSGDRYCARLQSVTRREITKLLPAFLGEMAFELNIIALYAMRCLGASTADLQNAVQQHASKPVPLPIKNALSLASTHKKPRRLPKFVPIGDEDGETADNY
jgi:hypothetical protein